MPKKKDHAFIEILWQFFLAAPWWIGPIVAFCTYVMVRYVIPWFLSTPISDGGDPGVQVMHTTASKITGGASAVIAPFATGFVLFLWIVSLFGKLHRWSLLTEIRKTDDIRSLSWRDFELLVGEYYRRRGYLVTELGGPSPDGGVDLLLRKDTRMTLVQCKHWKAFKVGVKPVRELLGLMTSEKAHTGILVTSGAFTKEAKEFANKNRIEIIDGDSLFLMIRSVKDTLPSAVQNPTRTVSAESVTPKCPRCRGPMVVRTARSGQNAGSRFYGCQRYPTCKGTRDIDDAN